VKPRTELIRLMVCYFKKSYTGRGSDLQDVFKSSSYEQLCSCCVARGVHV
jgi:hypothetical protein